MKIKIYLEINSNSLILSNIKNICDKEKDLNLKKQSNKEKRNTIQELKQQKFPTKDFATFITETLRYINVNLKIELDENNKDYIIKSTNENVILKVKDISEGEQNLLAILFFYYELFYDNKQQNIKKEIELIVIDDPISSLDDSNKFYILSIMRQLINLDIEQIFVLTHSWDDFCNMSYGKQTRANCILLEVKKKKGCSYLTEIKNQVKPYKYLFKEIYQFSQKNEEEYSVTDCEVYHYPNVMRRIFEEWYAFKTGRNINLTYNKLDELTSLFQINNSDKVELLRLLKICNILSHSINNSFNPQEILQALKYLMKLIENNDKLHFDKMKE